MSRVHAAPRARSTRPASASAGRTCCERRGEHRADVGDVSVTVSWSRSNSARCTSRTADRNRLGERAAADDVRGDRLDERARRDQVGLVLEHDLVGDLLARSASARCRRAAPPWRGWRTGPSRRPPGARSRRPARAPPPATPARPASATAIHRHRSPSESDRSTTPDRSESGAWPRPSTSRLFLRGMDAINRMDAAAAARPSLDEQSVFEPLRSADRGRLRRPRGHAALPRRHGRVLRPLQGLVHRRARPGRGAAARYRHDSGCAAARAASRRDIPSAAASSSSATACSLTATGTTPTCAAGPPGRGRPRRLDAG